MGAYEKVLFIGLAGLIVFTIVAILIVDAIRKKDFQDQISGKKPERKFDKNQKVSYDKKEAENSQIAIDREILRTKGGQNLMGPK